MQLPQRELLRRRAANEPSRDTQQRLCASYDGHACPPVLLMGRRVHVPGQLHNLPLDAAKLALMPVGQTVVPAQLLPVS